MHQNSLKTKLQRIQTLFNQPLTQFLGIFIVIFTLMSFIEPHSVDYSSISTELKLSIDSSSEGGSDTTDAEYVGGFEALYESLGNNLKYPDSALNARLSCTVIVEFIVHHDSSVTVSGTEGCPVHILNKEAARVVQLTSGKWIPAREKSNNKPISTVCRMPIEFYLDDE